MDVVKEDTCKRAVHLGRVRTTYRLVAGARGVSLDGSGRRRRTLQVGGVNAADAQTGDAHAAVVSRGAELIGLGVKGSMFIQSEF